MKLLGLALVGGIVVGWWIARTVAISWRDDRTVVEHKRQVWG